ncbi:MAG TPA: VWA domain-containing protein [Candidatus Eremiobacteraceae bacterium]|nr:VWA domain-containing protein [Candidatus Eremiobacteraceae bacterium]
MNLATTAMPLANRDSAPASSSAKHPPISLVLAKRIGLLVVTLTLVTAATRAQAPAGPINPQPGVAVQKAPTNIKVRTLLVNTPVTVRNEKGEMVDDLEKTDFHITDNGVPQIITHFNLGGDPISLVVVVETSSRIGPILPQIRKSGILISQTVMGPTGEGAIVGFNNHVDVLLNFTDSADDMDKAMSGLKAGDPGARLYDAMSKAVEMLSARPEVSATDLGKRRVMLVIAEAHDTGSEDTLGEVLRRAQLANITIYSVGISGARADLTRKSEPEPAPSPTPDGIIGMPGPPGTVQTPTNAENVQGGGNLLALAVWAVQHVKDKVTAHQLDIAAVGTGGTYVSTWKNRSIENAIDEIGGELHSQYTISYTPHGDLTEGYHEIKITVDRKHLNVRARPGYYIEPPQ